MAFLIDIWAPMFAIDMGISRGQMEDLSVPQIVDHVQYLRSRNEG